MKPTTLRCCGFTVDAKIVGQEEDEMMFCLVKIWMTGEETGVQEVVKEYIQDFRLALDILNRPLHPQIWHLQPFFRGSSFGKSTQLNQSGWGNEF